MNDKAQIEVDFDQFEDSTISFTNLFLLGDGAEEELDGDEFTQVDHLETLELKRFSKSELNPDSRPSLRAIRNTIVGKF